MPVRPWRSLIDDAQRVRRLGGLTISQTVHPAGSTLAAHYHERDLQLRRSHSGHALGAAAAVAALLAASQP
jgi:hypothetical protein